MARSYKIAMVSLARDSVSHTPAGINRGTDLDAGCNCIGSGCAAWVESPDCDQPMPRHCDAPNPSAKTADEAGEPMSDAWTFHPYDSSDGTPAGWVESEAVQAANRRGSCGLIGRIEIITNN